MPREIKKINDSWRTPDWLFDELNKEFNFDIDLCATKENRKCAKYAVDYLNDLYAVDLNGGVFPVCFKDINNNCAFMNPPYSNPKPFIEKAWEDSKHCKIICLVKCDPSTRWWSTFWDYSIECPDCEEGVWFYDRFDTPNMGAVEDEMPCGTGKGSMIVNRAKPGCGIRYFPKRIKFDPPQELIDSGEVWYTETYNTRGNGVGAWVQKCKECSGNGYHKYLDDAGECFAKLNCGNCRCKGYKELSGPSFSSVLIIMDRRGL